MRVRPGDVDDLPAMAAIAARCQADPARYVAYVADDAAAIADEVGEVDDCPSATAVATDADGAVRGWLLAEVDLDMGRVWWWGPFVDASDEAAWTAVADDLFAGSVPAARSAPEQELAVDARSERFRELAARLDFSPDPGSVLLRLVPSAASLDAPSDVAIAPLDATHAGAVAALHDGLFAGTHTPGRTLVDAHDERHPRYVALEGGACIGYVAVEHQADGSVYVDYLGVDAARRGRGVGRRLVAHAVAQAFAAGASGAHLTAREANAAARALYASLGFAEERVLQPYRRGFTLP